MSAQIPIVSFAPFLTGDKASQQRVAQEVYEAFSTIGFVYLKDHGIPLSAVDSIFAESARFFALPKSTKTQYALRDASVNQGYTADGAEGIGDHKECYEHRRINELCPDDTVLPEFQHNVDAFYGQCFTLAMNVLRCLAIAMGLGADFFEKNTRKADPQLRLLHYPSIQREVIEQPTESRIGAHTDFGLCTLLFQDSVGGLEIDPFHTGKFCPAPPIEGTCLVNIGDLMERYTNGRCRSTLHRVKAPHGVNGVLPSRYSIPYFVHPDPDTLIDPILLEEGEVKKFKAVNAREWREYNTRRNYGLGREKTSLSRVNGDAEIV